MGESNLIAGFRIGTLVVGVILLGLGIYSYASSKWSMDGDILAHHKTCEVDRIKNGKLDNPCPSIMLEQYYIIIIISCFLISVGLEVLSCLVNMTSNPFRLVDMYYHIAGAVVLLISGLVYIVSAILIRNIYGDAEKAEENLAALAKLEVKGGFRYEEKLAAGALAMIQAILYGVMAFLVH